MNESHALRRLLRFLWQFRLWLLISLLCAFISVLFSVIAPLLIGRIIDGITSGTALHAVMRELVLLAALYLSYSLFNWGMMYASNRIAFVSSCVLRRQLEAKMEKLPVSFYDRHARGDLISRFINDIDFISDGFLQGLSTMLSGAATIVLTLVFMLRINWIMALIVTVSAPFTYLVARIIAVRTGRYFRAQANVLGRLNGYGEEMLSGIRTLKAYGYEEEAVRQFEQYDAQLYDAGVKAQFYGSLANPSTRFVMNTAYAAVGGAGALLALAGQITIGSISSFLMYSNLFSKPFTEISGVMTQLQSAVSSAQRVFDLLDEPQEDADGEQVLQVREGRVDFLHVRFGYEPGQPLMKDITLHVPAGSRVAIVFGCEDRGLSNADIEQCQRLVTIPTAGEASSLNLAQAILILTYECMKAVSRVDPQPSLGNDPGQQSRRITHEEQALLYARLKETLLAIDYLKSDNPDYFLMPLRRFLGKSGLRRHEMDMLMGICRQMDNLRKEAGK